MYKPSIRITLPDDSELQRLLKEYWTARHNLTEHLKGDLYDGEIVLTETKQGEQEAEG